MATKMVEADVVMVNSWPAEEREWKSGWDVGTSGGVTSMVGGEVFRVPVSLRGKKGFGGWELQDRPQIKKPYGLLVERRVAQGPVQVDLEELSPQEGKPKYVPELLVPINRGFLRWEQVTLVLYNAALFGCGAVPRNAGIVRMAVLGLVGLKKHRSYFGFEIKSPRGLFYEMYLNGGMWTAMHDQAEHARWERDFHCSPERFEIVSG